MRTDVLAMHQWLVSLIGEGDVLDVGCGHGDDLRLMADGNTHGHLVGIDSRQETIDTAVSLTQDPRISFLCASADGQLPFEKASFDAVYSVNTLECLSDKQGFLQECHRVLKPGGQLLLAHWDWDTQTFDGSDKHLTRKIVHAFNDWKQAWMNDIDPWMGRRLWKAVQASQLFEGRIESRTLISTEFAEGSFAWDQAHSFKALVKRDFITQDEFDRFIEEQNQLVQNNQFFHSLTMFVYIGHGI